MKEHSKDIAENWNGTTSTSSWYTDMYEPFLSSDTGAAQLPPSSYSCRTRWGGDKAVSYKYDIYDVRIIDICHDDLTSAASSGYGETSATKAGLTFQFVKTLRGDEYRTDGGFAGAGYYYTTGYRMNNGRRWWQPANNPNNYELGTGTGAWGLSRLRAWMNPNELNKKEHNGWSSNGFEGTALDASGNTIDNVELSNTLSENRRTNILPPTDSVYKDGKDYYYQYDDDSIWNQVPNALRTSIATVNKNYFDANCENQGAYKTVRTAHDKLFILSVSEFLSLPSTYFNETIASNQWSGTDPLMLNEGSLYEFWSNYQSGLVFLSRVNRHEIVQNIYPLKKMTILDKNESGNSAYTHNINGNNFELVEEWSRTHIADTHTLWNGGFPHYFYGFKENNVLADQAAYARAIAPAFCL